MITHLTMTHTPRVPGEDGRDQRGGGGGGDQWATPQPRDRGALPRQQQHQVDVGDCGGHHLRRHHQGAPGRRGETQGGPRRAAGEVCAGGAMETGREAAEKGQLLVKNLASLGSRGP